MPFQAARHQGLLGPYPRGDWAALTRFRTLHVWAGEPYRHRLRRASATQLPYHFGRFGRHRLLGEAGLSCTEPVPLITNSTLLGSACKRPLGGGVGLSQHHCKLLRINIQTGRFAGRRTRTAGGGATDDLQRSPPRGLDTAEPPPASITPAEVVRGFNKYQATDRRGAFRRY